ACTCGDLCPSGVGQKGVFRVIVLKRRHFVDLFMHVMRSLDSSPLSLVWIVLLIDCFMNTDLKGPQKLWWILFILITQFFGALLYFFLGPAQIYRNIVDRMNQPYQSSDTAQTQPPPRQQWDQYV